MLALPFSASAQVRSFSIASPVILLVEDDPLLRGMTAANLQDIGMRVLEAGDAAAAIQILQTAAHADVLFTDIQMPGAMDGFGLARWAALHRSDIGIVMTSGVIKPGALPADLSGRDFLAKPYDFDALVLRLNSLYERRVHLLATSAENWP